MIREILMFTFTFLLDIHQDVENWLEGSNKISHGKNRKEGVALEYQYLVDQLQGVSAKEAEDFMIPFLENLYKDKKETIDKTFLHANQLFEEKFQEACTSIETMTKKELYLKEYTLFLTTFPRCPYNEKKGYVWLPVFRDYKVYLGTFLHELQHFQVHQYYQDTLMKELSNKEFDFLKESLTIILNDECLEFLGQIDAGYPIHQGLRRDLLREWRHHHDFQKLIGYGCQQVKKYVK